MAAVVHRLAGPALLAHRDGIRAVYAAAFAEPPWHAEPAEADGYLTRLAGDVQRPGFAGAVALDGERVLGFATAWTSSTPLPGTRSYPRVTAALGAERAAAWLCGGTEVDELAVSPAAHGRGLGRTLLEAVTRDAPDARCWLLTSVRADATVRFYERLGWRQVTHPAPDGYGTAVFLGPGHPARAAAVLPSL
ncbi:GNAT family N-acetyltransferase [Streptomyces spectabilis]|uniref:N-acetyltransferase n=1 Tax=Streptomyces spectabilis TaxID=68270 RepID=A0A5P2XGP3_STRST|nr:GNAT family N-acetyltransferase [Streptomyces spectabilis]MBB5101850.1 ribosomal protein S18 acetylase RimI-like enzyme [Streptomyces spectabilis]MCI3906902.1 GNAT family N-acetyltransferase [Streptomyces spectabilis]QEV63691.1 N-acetyltransferase [Streptomyces spectabilis]GGV34616.1 N-acetyltransferase [Streptomyces spectabilis]